MKKKLFGMVLAAALVVAQTVSVFAAGSKTASMTLDPESSGDYVLTESIEEASAFQALEEDAQETATLIRQVNDGSATMSNFIEAVVNMVDSIAGMTQEAVTELQANLTGKAFVTQFYDLIAQDGVERTAEGKYRTTLSVPAMTANTEEIAVLHYSTVRELWEIIDPLNVDYDAKTITVEFEDLSPIAIIAKEGTFSTDAVGSQSQGTSPKTGASMSGAVWMGGAVVLMGMAAVVFTRKKEA